MARKFHPDKAFVIAPISGSAYPLSDRVTIASLNGVPNYSSNLLRKKNINFFSPITFLSKFATRFAKKNFCLWRIRRIGMPFTRNPGVKKN
jgi:hypothetical protein